MWSCTSVTDRWTDRIAVANTMLWNSADRGRQRCMGLGLRLWFQSNRWQIPDISVGIMTQDRLLSVNWVLQYSGDCSLRCATPHTLLCKRLCLNGWKDQWMNDNTNVFSCFWLIHYSLFSLEFLSEVGIMQLMKTIIKLGIPVPIGYVFSYPVQSGSGLISL